MARMNAGIILGGQQPNFLSTIDQANTAAARQGQFQQQNALRQFNRQSGDEVLSGNQNALSQYAQIAGPEAALGVKSTQQAMQFDAEQMQLARQQAKIKAAEAVAKMSEQERKERAERLASGLRGAAQFYAQGDEEGYNRWLQQNNLDPQQFPFEAFPAHAASLTGVYDALTAAEERVGGGDMSAAEEQIARMESIGIPRDVAIRIADGVYAVSRDPTTEEVQVIDKSSGDVIFTASQQRQQARQAAQQQAPAQVQQGGLSFGDQYPAAQDAFGVEGATKGLINTVGDAAGFGTAYPDVQQAQSDFGVLREKLINDIAAGYARQPPSWLLKNIQGLTPEAGRVFEGPEQAQAKLNAIARDLQGELDTANRSLVSRSLSPTTREKLESRVTSLNSAMNRIVTALQSLEGQDAQNTTSSGVKWSILE